MNVGAVADVVATPLFGVTLTLAVYLLACRLASAARGNPLANPVLVSIVVIVAVLMLSRTSYHEYHQGGQLIGFLLGPATVALAVPLHRQRTTIRDCAAPTLVGIGVGAVTGVLVALTATVALGGDHELARTMAPKSVTAPVAIALSQANSGLPELTAVLTILTGVLGAVAGPMLLSAVRVRDERVRGLAIGTASHGIGTARALADGDITGAFSALAMALNAVVTSLALPLLLAALRW